MVIIFPVYHPFIHTHLISDIVPHRIKYPAGGIYYSTTIGLHLMYEGFFISGRSIKAS